MDSTDDKLDRIVEALNRVNVNIESLRVSMSAVTEHTEDQEKRLRSIERWRYNLTPFLAVVLFVLGAVVTEMLKRFI